MRRVRDTGNESNVVIRETGSSQVNHHVEIKDTDVQQSSSTTAASSSITPTDLSEIRWPMLVTASYGNFSLDHRVKFVIFLLLSHLRLSQWKVDPVVG